MTKKEFSERVIELEKSLYYTAKTILKNDDDCADAVQDALLAAYKKLSILKREEYFKTWITRILINRCKSMARSRRYHEDIDTLGETSQAESGLGLQEIVMEINALDVKPRLPFVLYYSEGFTVCEISQILKISESNVKVRFHRARQALQQRIGGIDYEA